MALRRNKRIKRGKRRILQAVKGGTLRLRKAPHPEPASDAEEKLPRAGILRFDAKGWRLPEALAEASETESNGFLPGRVVSIITILAVVFIAIIAWFVSHMPKK